MCGVLGGLFVWSFGFGWNYRKEVLHILDSLIYKVPNAYMSSLRKNYVVS